MSVHDSPLPVLTPVHMGNPQGVGRGLTVNLHAIVLVPDGVGQITTGARRNNLEVVFGRVGEPGRNRMEHGVELGPTGPGALGTEHRHRIGPRPEREPRFNIAVMYGCLSRTCLGSISARNSSTSVPMITSNTVELDSIQLGCI